MSEVVTVFDFNDRGDWTLYGLTLMDEGVSCLFSTVEA